MTKKKLFVMLTIALVVSVAGYFAYNHWFKKKSVAKATSIGANFQMVAADKEGSEADRLAADSSGASDPNSMVLAGTDTDTENSSNK